MPQPTPRLDDDALIGRILDQVPEAGDARRVRSLLAAWWRYAGVRNAAGAVVDSETFVAERGALGLLEMPPGVAKRVIELLLLLRSEGLGGNHLFSSPDRAHARRRPGIPAAGTCE
jgi:hypothetical protein